MTQNYPWALEISDLQVNYGRIKALCGVNLRIEKGESCALLGMNGSGKSTLYKTIMGLLSPQQGEIKIMGERPLRARQNAWVGYVPQSEQIDPHFPLSVAEVVMMGRYAFMGSARRAKSDDHKALRLALETVNLESLAERAIGDLSGGQRKRAFIARAIAQGARLLLLDEPFAGVDKDSEALIIDLLNRLRENGVTILVSTHDLNSVPRFCENAALINRIIHYYGRVEQALQPEALLPAFSDYRVD